MDMADVGRWATAVGAVVAAVTGTWNLWIQLKRNRDHFRVGLGTLSPSPSLCDKDTMHVVSLSDHKIVIADYGFITLNHGVLSMHIVNEEGLSDSFHALERGSRVLNNRGDHFDACIVAKSAVMVGVYARSNTQIFPQIKFSKNAPLLKRPYFRWKYFVKKKINIPPLF